ncbi:Acetyl-CoA synthetase (ADP-forming) alpha and beta chains, putative [hydrothermal vent metagenome]|uniref:Acetyl-CoA synthetase (ADP-forming) alpha and beta chains, putative n=1 Tax=hydrothermal vent metagenome TaxID=652676 RepID=A0A3B0QTB5_9ZZZZ
MISIDELIKDGVGSLVEPEVKGFLKECSIAVPRSFVEIDLEVAIVKAAEIGYPLVLKVVSRDIIHKSDVGGVAVGLRDEQELRRAWNEIYVSIAHRCPSAKIEGFLVEEMAPRGVEVIVGALRDEQFGPTVMFGMGGVAIELLKDVSFRLAPIDEAEAIEMMKECKGFPLLSGYRGNPAKDVKAAAGVIVKLADIITESKLVKEFEINPLVVHGDGCMALDARAILL